MNLWCNGLICLSPVLINVIIPVCVRNTFLRTSIRPFVQMPHPSGLDGTHLQRFSVDQSRFLSAYGVFHGDERHPGGEPLPTGSLRKKTGTSSSSASPYFQSLPGPPASYLIQPTMSLRSLTQRHQPASGKTLPSNRSVGLNSTTYSYGSGVSFNSTSGASRMHTSRIVRTGQ